MKAPDKIWVREFAEGVNQMWSHIKATETSAIEQHEYIRKDALLEKLEKVAAEYKKRSDKGELVWQHMCGVKEAINILNKM